ncbi:hypothetical protein KPL71_022152 [Citrus sinensis]|uniref:Uncharacterized protein n=1 Tax=Citrus sinensis TaxID=2711 RepID=A0ACB8JLE4_CITSI|nr:hypothetical protein KPL71_022152 [Citrus sinensis]
MEGKKDKGNDNTVIQINTDTEESHLREQAKNLKSAASREDEDEEEEKEEEEGEEDDENIIIVAKPCHMGSRAVEMVSVSIGDSLWSSVWIFLFDYGYGVKRSKETSKIFHHITRTLASFVAGAAVCGLKSSMSSELDVFSEIKSESEAKNLADKIIKKLETPQSEFIGEQKLKEFLDDEQHVKKMLKLFRAVKSGKINKADFKKWVIKVYNDRKTLKRSLNDAKTAIEELNRILSGIVVVVIIIVWLLVMGLLTYKVIAVITSQLLLLAFMFGNTARTCFEAIIFVFVTHPFDVGDRCFIDGVQVN